MARKLTAEQREDNRQAQKDMAVLVGGAKLLRLTLAGMTFPPFKTMGDDLRAATDEMLAKYEAAGRKLKV